MGKPKGRVGHSRGLADMTVTVEGEPQQHYYDPSDLVREDFVVHLAHNAQVRLRLVSWHTKLVDFCLQQEHRYGEDDDWQEVVRVDCAHDQPVHVHRFAADGTELSRAVLSNDVDEGYDLGNAIVFEQWQENLRRWERGQ